MFKPAAFKMKKRSMLVKISGGACLAESYAKEVMTAKEKRG
jgi:hypothetical protein